MSKLSDLIGNLNDRPSRTIQIPGRDDQQVAIWCLTVYEGELARKAAYKYVQKELAFSSLDLEYDEYRALDDAVICETLARALRDPDEKINAYCEDADDIRKRLTPGEVLDLWKEYNDFTKERTTLKDVQDIEKELDEMVETIRRGHPLMARLSRYASPALRRLMLSVLDRFVNGTHSNASDGSSPSTPESG